MIYALTCDTRMLNRVIKFRRKLKYHVEPIAPKSYRCIPENMVIQCLYPNHVVLDIPFCTLPGNFSWPKLEALTTYDVHLWSWESSCAWLANECTFGEKIRMGQYISVLSDQNSSLSANDYWYSWIHIKGNCFSSFNHDQSVKILPLPR